LRLPPGGRAGRLSTIRLRRGARRHDVFPVQPDTWYDRPGLVRGRHRPFPGWTGTHVVLPVTGDRATFPLQPSARATGTNLGR
jgi:hypothetical protein